MSLVASYALADDGKWYSGPTLGVKGQDYFVCFDDDDPIELVIANHTGLTPEDVFKTLGLDAEVTSRPHGGSQRYFDGRFETARSWWVEIHKPFPVSAITEHDGVQTDMPFQGVLYDFGAGLAGLKK